MAKQQPKRKRYQEEDWELEQAYRRTSSRGRKHKKARGSRGGAILAICIAMLAITIGILAACFYVSNNVEEGLILKNVSIAGVDVGGMTKDGAIQLVTQAIGNTYSQKSMVIRIGEDQIEISPAESGASLNITAAVEAAYAYGRTGSAAQQQSEQNAAMLTGHQVDLTPYFTVNTSIVKEKINTIGAHYSSTLRQTAYELTGSVPSLGESDAEAEGLTLVITVGTPEYVLDLNKLFDQVITAYHSNQFLVETDCPAIEPNPLDLEAILSEVYIAPVDASMDMKTFEVAEGSYGYGFDAENAQALLDRAAYGETIEIAFKRIPPEITAESLSGTLFRDVLGTYTAANASDPDRDVNLALACQAIDGTVLQPGDVFSYNEALGERTEANGYRPGPSYAGNETVYTIGGGICQVSSPLYYCALVADLEIVERENHGFATSYMPLGLDATVSWGTLDFVFRNNMAYPIRIEATASEGNVTVSIIGTDDRDYYVKMETEVQSTYNYETTYQKMSADNDRGYKDGDFIVTPYTGYDVKTYRCRYNKETNALISRDYEDFSDYRKRDAVVCQIDTEETTPTRPDVSGSVSDGPGALPPE